MASNLFNTGFAKFVETLHERMERREVLADLKATYDHLLYRVLPLYELNYKVTPRKNEVNESIMEALKDSNAKSAKNSLDGLHAVLKNIHDNEDAIIALIEKSVGKIQLKQALDYKTLNVLYYIESMNFFVEFAYMAYNAVIAEECSMAGITELSVLDKRDRREVMQLQTLTAVSKIIDVMLMKVDDFEKKLEAGEGLLYSQADYEAVRIKDSKKVDPVGFGFIPLWLHLPYHMALKFNELESLRIQKAEQDKMRIQFMIQALEEQEANATTDEERAKRREGIEYYNNLLNRIDQKIAKYENA